jgi:hypothetical protein
MADANPVLNREMPVFVDAADTFGNFFCFVTRALQVRHNLADPQNQTQVRGCGLALRDDVGAIVVNRFFEFVNFTIGFNDGLDTGDLTSRVGIDGR